MTAGLASQYIVAADKAYKLGGSVEKLAEILDGGHHIANQNSVTMSDLAEGMSAVGSPGCFFRRSGRRNYRCPRDHDRHDTAGRH